MNQTAEPEQPQEDVQLTELQPVKQSGIKESTVKDAVTDALRVLHRFSEDCDDDRFGPQEFKLSHATDRELERSRKKKRQTETRRKHTGRSKSNTADDNKKIINGIDVRDENATKALRSTKRKRNEGECKTEEKPIAKDTDDDDVEFDEEDDDEDLVKTECFQDEIYVYRQEPCSNSEPEDTEGTSRQRTQRKTPAKGGVNLKEKTARQRKNLSRGKSRRDEKKQEYRSVNVAKKRKLEREIKSELENNNDVDSAEPEATRDNDRSTTASAVTGEKSGDTCQCNGNMEQMEKSLEEDEEESYDGSILDKSFCCLICDARFKGTAGLRNHYKVVHTSGPLFRCNDCGKEFPLKERLKLHLRIHTGYRPYKCTDCDKCFARGSQLVQHRRTHSRERPYRCNLCSNSFTCSANLVLHIKRHRGQKDHKCHLCGRAFVRRDALRKHLECLHRDVKSFLCVICNKAFKGHLPQHMRTHVHDRPHRCSTCGQQFAQRSQLTVHQRTHSGQRPFRCLVCWQAFAHSTALKLHTRRHTGERPFTCSECQAGFTQLPHWKKHMKSIHGKDDPYNCKRCKTFFRMKCELDKHEKTCHPEEDEEDNKNPGSNSEIVEKNSVTAKHKLMTVERMRLLLAVLLKRISKQQRLDELGFGKRLIDDVLQDSLIAAGKKPIKDNGLSVLETLTRNLEIFLEWTMPKEHWRKFCKAKKSPQEILEALTAP